MTDKPRLISTTAARQGGTGTNSGYVLFIGMVLAVTAGVILFFTVGT
jgi:hypothetical protein